MPRLKWPFIGSLGVLIPSFVLVYLTGKIWADLIVVVAALLVLWPLTRMSKREMGLRWGDRRSYIVGLLYPVGVAAVLGLAASFSGNTDVNRSLWEIAWRIALMSVSTLIGVMITEEGFFRGWLWGSLERAGVGATGTVLWTAGVFAMWHIPAATMEPAYSPSPEQLPIYLGNVVVLGLIWSVVRAVSGSIVMTSFTHGIWNGLVYVLFGFGTTVGALGITRITIFGPERGILGLGLNLVALVWLWRWWKKRTGHSTAGAAKSG